MKLHITSWPEEAGTVWGDNVLTLRYHQALKLASGADTETNTLLTELPTAYMFGALVQAAIYLQDAPAQGNYEAYYNEALDQLQRQTRRAQTTDLMSATSIGAY